MPPLGLKSQKVDSAPKNGPNLIYDSLLEAYEHVVWFSDKNFSAPIFHPSQGVNPTPPKKKTYTQARLHTLSTFPKGAMHQNLHIRTINLVV